MNVDEKYEIKYSLFKYDSSFERISGPAALEVAIYGISLEQLYKKILNKKYGGSAIDSKKNIIPFFDGIDRVEENCVIWKLKYNGQVLKLVRQLKLLLDNGEYWFD